MFPGCSGSLPGTGLNEQELVAGKKQDQKRAARKKGACMQEETAEDRRGVYGGAMIKPPFDSMQDPKFRRRFHDQRKRVLQLLRDWKLPYSTGRGSMEGEDPVPYIDRSGIFGDHWPLNAEAERHLSDGAAAKSMRLVEAELSWMARFMPYAYEPLRKVFLHDAAGDDDYEHLKVKAGRFEESRRLLDEVEVALYVLTMRLMDRELYAVFGERTIRRTHRRQTTEESYQEIHRVFEGWCQKLGLRRKRFRNKALENTAAQCEVARSTVERAIRFVEADKLKGKART